MTWARRILTVSVLVFVMGSGEAFRAEAANPWALLIGVDDYIQAQDLKYCGKDQLAMAEQLVASGFPEDQVFVLHDNATDRKYLPFKRNIEKQLELVLGLIERGDVLILSFSGHGVHFEEESYLCPMDAELGNPATLLPLKMIYERLKHCRASLKLMLIDACRNDPRPGGQRTFKAADTTRSFARSLAAEPLPEGVVLLNSCTAGEISYEEDDFGHGVFMHYVLAGMRGDADRDGDGKVSLGELSRWAGTKTKVYVARQFNDSQRPFLTGEYELGLLDFEFGSSCPRQITNSLGMKLVLISAGEFMMGSPGDEEERFDEEQQHRVRITKPFYLGVYEVTQEQYEKVMDVEPAYFFVGKDLPAEVSWDQATEFCRRLGQKEGTTYRLPTEAQWEYACRAGTTTPFAFGETLSSETDANFDGSGFPYGNSGKGPSRERTTPVGSFRANAWGLYDMHGNLSEWCADWYDEDYYNRSPLDDPQGPTSGIKRVVRGGCYDESGDECRSAYRWGNPPDYEIDGFRVIRIP
jgi:formylglycine-generating enzyme required for sulfatase activity